MHWITGTGSGHPQGLLPGTTSGKTAASQTQIAYDDLVDLQHSVDAACREGGELGPDGTSTAGGDLDSVAWVMRDTTLGHLRKTKDHEGRPILEPDVKRGAPNTILGYRVVLYNGMPAIAAGTTPTAFGNIRAAYVIRDVRTVEVMRLVERFAALLQVAFLGNRRSDGLVQDQSAVRS